MGFNSQKYGHMLTNLSNVTYRRGNFHRCKSRIWGNSDSKIPLYHFFFNYFIILRKPFQRLKTPTSLFSSYLLHGLAASCKRCFSAEHFCFMFKGIQWKIPSSSEQNYLRRFIDCYMEWLLLSADAAFLEHPKLWGSSLWLVGDLSHPTPSTYPSFIFMGFFSLVCFKVSNCHVLSGGWKKPFLRNFFLLYLIFLGFSCLPQTCFWWLVDVKKANSGDPLKWLLICHGM